MSAISPGRTAELSRVEDAGLNASATPQQRWLDGWLLRLSPGKAKRARCVNALAPGRLALGERIALCEQVYAEVGLPLIIRVTPFSEPAHFDAVLAAAGLLRFDDTRVMLLPELQAGPMHRFDGLELCLLAPEDFAFAVGALRGSPDAQRRAHADRLRHAAVAASAYVLRRDGEVVACGQTVREGDIVGLYDVYTAPSARGQGLAGALCTEMMRRARAEGARRAYLQVEGENHAARSLYHRLGFADAYAYHYRARDPLAA